MNSYAITAPKGLRSRSWKPGWMAVKIHPGLRPYSLVGPCSGLLCAWDLCNRLCGSAVGPGRGG